MRGWPFSTGALDSIKAYYSTLECAEAQLAAPATSCPVCKGTGQPLTANCSSSTSSSGGAAAAGMSVRRSPTNFKQLLPYNKVNGSHQLYPVQHHSARSRCIRCLRWLLPMLLIALLSSYTTYLILYQAPIAHFHAKGAWHSADSTQQQEQHQVLELTAQDQGKTDADSISNAATAAAAAAAGTGEAGHTAAPHPQGSQQPPPLAPADAATRWLKATGRRMTVAIINEAPYHLEIVAGFLHILAQLPVDVTWYQAGQNAPQYSAVDLLEMTGFTRLLGYLPRMKPSNEQPDPVDFALFISPEYFEKETAAFLKAAKPITAVILGHNGMNHALQRIQTFHPRLHFAALAPHVAAASRQVLHIHTHWMMATFPFMSKNPCSLTSLDATTCLSGFSIQGNFETARRNYTRIWQQMASAHALGQLPTSPPVKPFHLHLVGRGDVKTLGIPAAVHNMTTVHFNLLFPQYYDQIYHTHALLMLLGSNNYLLQKMSSTIVSSLMTGTPIIADAKVLASYTFLKPEHVYLMGPHDTEMDVMQRILRMSPAEVFAVRQRVVDLGEHLNRRTTQVLQTFMPMVEDAPAGPAVEVQKKRE